MNIPINPTENNAMDVYPPSISGMLEYPGLGSPGKDRKHRAMNTEKNKVNTPIEKRYTFCCAPSKVMKIANKLPKTISSKREKVE